MSWNQSFDVYISHRNQETNSSNLSEQIIKFKFSEWPRQQTITLGPFTKSGMTLNFCYKHRNTTALDKGAWPSGNYGIYADENGCPEGKVFKVFKVKEHKLKVQSRKYISAIIFLIHSTA